MTRLGSEGWGTGAGDEGEGLGLLRMGSGGSGEGLLRGSQLVLAELGEEVLGAIGSA